MKNYKCWPKFNPRSLNYPEIPVCQFLRSSAAKWPFRIAIIFDAIEITYSELLTLTERLATALAGLGVRKGDRVAIHLPNSPQFAIAYYATLMNGAIFTPFSPLMVERELDYQLNDSGAETIITLDLFYPTVEKVVPRTKVKNVIVASIPDIFPPLLTAIRPPLVKKEFPGTLDFSALLKAHEAKPPEVKIDARKDLAHLGYTGGTTGVSKGVMLTHFNVVANVLQIAHWLGGGNISYRDGILNSEREEGDREEDHPLRFGKGKALIVVPWFHAMGSIGYLNQTIYSGTTMVVFPRFDPGAEFSLRALPPGECGLRLMSVLVNTRLRRDRGFSAVTYLARACPAYALSYGHVAQLDRHLGELEAAAGLARIERQRPATAGARR